MNTKNINLKNDKVLTIRKASPYDAKYIVEYLNIVGGESDNLLFGKDEFHLSEQDEAKYIDNINSSENSIMIIGIIDNIIVSVCQLSAPNRKRIEHNVSIVISVRKSYWNLGIGSAMMSELIDFARRNENIKNIHLGVRDENTNAVKLYEKFGFKKIGLHKNCMNIEGKYYDEILMDLYL